MNSSKYLPMSYLQKLFLMACLACSAQFSFAQITGDTDLCPGGFEIYTYTEVNVCDTNYTWTINPPIGTIVGNANEAFIQVQWLEPGVANLCLTVEDSCGIGAPPVCTAVTVSPIPPTEINAEVCEGDCVVFGGQSFCNPGAFEVVLVNYQGCDSLLLVNVTMLPTSFTDLGTVTLDCTTTQFEVCGQTFVPGGGPQTAVCTSFMGCDSIVTFNLVADINAPVADAGPAQTLDCLVSSVILDGSGSSQGPEFTYEWMGPNGFASFTLNPTVSEPGTYCLTVTDASNGCQSMSCVEIVADATVPAVAVADGVLPCDGSSGIVDATFSGGGNIELLWSTLDGNILSGETTIAPEVDAPGTYCLLVTDVTTGCTAEACAIIMENPQILMSGPNELCPDTPTALEVFLFANAPTDAFYYSENDGPVSQINVSGSTGTILLDIAEPTTLKVWATDLDGCESDTATFELGLIEYEVEFDVAASNCQPTLIMASVSGEPSSLFTFDWSNGEQGENISVTSTGQYHVTATDFDGCATEGSVFVTVDYTGNCAFIEGHVRDDLNLDCALDAGDVPLDGWLVGAVGPSATFFGTTDADGFYSIPVDPGDYTVSVHPPTNLWLPCENALDASLASVDEVAVADFFVEKLPGCPQLTVDISTWILRRCFSNNHYTVGYCNEGTEDATGAYVELQVDEFLIVLGASVPYQDLGDHLFRFEIGDVAVGECGTFSVNIEVSCDASLGQTHCTEAHIFPDTLCGAPDPNWTGADLQTEAECADSVYFTITNVGTGTMADILQYVVIEDAVMYMEVTDGPPLGPGESHVFAVPANGSTWRVEVVQEPFHPSESSHILALFEACGVNGMGSFSTGFVNQFSLFDDDPFIDEDCRENIGAYDPNDKQGFPRGYGDDHLILPGTELEYLIRFQNTGTDTAFNIVIRDTLAGEFDVTTVRPGAGSHPYHFEIYGDGILKFTFADIMLPDSNVNEPLSHGFVEFKVAHRPDLPLHTVLENSAAIYFDFNEPIITNTTDHELAIDFPAVNQVEVAMRGVELEVFPNPFDDAFQINLTGIDFGKKLKISLLDPLGKIVRVENFTPPGLLFDAGDLPSGLYFFKVEMEGTLVASGKLMKN